MGWIDTINNRLRIATLALSLPFIGCATTEAEKFYRDFPDDIPDVLEIHKYDDGSFQHCLVHVVNMHYISDMPKNKHGILKEFQEDVTSILRDLDERFNLDFVYGEGLAVGSNMELYLDNVRFMHESYQKSLEETEKMKEEGYDVVSMQLYGTDSLEDLAEISSFLYSPMDRLAVEGIFAIRPSETKDALEKAMDEYNTGVLGFHVLDGRENAVLDVLANDNLPYYFLVFGGGHNFADNIFEWNEKHPENRFAYIKIFPFAVKRVFESMNEEEKNGVP